MSWELYLQNSSVHPFIYLLYMILGASSETSTGRVASEYLKDRVAMSETKSASSRFYSAREIRQVLKSIWSRYQEKGGSREARRAMEAQWGKDDIPSGKTWWKSESVLGINLKSVRRSSVSASGQCELGTKIGRNRGVPTSKSCLKEFVLSPLTVLDYRDAFTATPSRANVQLQLLISQRRHFLLQLRHPGSMVKDFCSGKVAFQVFKWKGFFVLVTFLIFKVILVHTVFYLKSTKKFFKSHPYSYYPEMIYFIVPHFSI